MDDAIGLPSFFAIRVAESGVLLVIVHTCEAERLDLGGVTKADDAVDTLPARFR